MKYDEYIQYGDLLHAEQFQRLHDKCKKVSYFASILAKTEFGSTLTTSSIFRKKTNDSGIHEAYRAIDFVPLKSISDTYRLLQMINSLYIYDSRVYDTPSIFSDEELKRRLKLRVADENPYHGTGFHIHLQVHNNTCVMTKSQELVIVAQAHKDKMVFTPKSLA